MRVTETCISTLCWQPPPCPSLPFLSPKVANKGNLSCAASAPPLSQPGYPPRQSIPCQENEPKPVLNASLCVHGRTGHTLKHGTKVDVKNIHGTATPDLPSPLAFPALLFFGVAPSYGGHSERQTTEEAGTRRQVWQQKTGGPRGDNIVGLLAYLTNY